MAWHSISHYKGFVLVTSISELAERVLVSQPAPDKFAHAGAGAHVSGNFDWNAVVAVDATAVELDVEVPSDLIVGDGPHVGRQGQDPTRVTEPGLPREPLLVGHLREDVIDERAVPTPQVACNAAYGATKGVKHLCLLAGFVGQAPR
jgi:hypothetical protein